MGKRDRERRGRGDFIVKHEPPSAPVPFESIKEKARLLLSAMPAGTVLVLDPDKPEHVWAMRRPLPPEETDTEAHP